MAESADSTIEISWTAACERWLRQYAPATQRAYAAAYHTWCTGLSRPPWLATSADVVIWIETMREHGLAPASINQRLGAVSSLYTCIIRSDEGLFVDARGNPRANPFLSPAVRRARGRKARPVKPLSREQLRAMRDAINPDTRTGARDLALFECYLRTGRRLSEIARLRWGDIDPDTGVFRWAGKGGKGGEQVLPAPTLAAIVAYLRADDRWPVSDPEMYVFLPLATHGVANLTDSAGQGHVSPGQIGRVIKKLARRAGLDDSQVHVHQIRHSFALYLYDATKDVRLVQQQLGHTYVSTTQTYLEGLGTPDDNVSAPLKAALGF
jgi:integrase